LSFITNAIKLESLLRQESTSKRKAKNKSQKSMHKKNLWYVMKHKLDWKKDPMVEFSRALNNKFQFFHTLVPSNPSNFINESKAHPMIKMDA